MEVKIKTVNGLKDATIEMVDGVMIVSPKEEMFEPKDGDDRRYNSYAFNMFGCKFKVVGNIYVDNSVLSENKENKQ